MFCVDEATAESIRRVFNEEGELSAVIELRRHFPLITETARRRECVRIIAGWRPVPPPAKGGIKWDRRLPARVPGPPRLYHRAIQFSGLFNAVVLPLLSPPCNT